ncbi:MAG: hypothetical protein ABIS18_11145 [Actinomycetota bacterium]
MKVKRLFVLLPVAVVATAVSWAAGAHHSAISCSRDSYPTQTLTSSANIPEGAEPIYRFVNLSDTHILDDEASPAITGNYLETAFEPGLGNGSAQRLQEEYTDEVLNAMVKTINHCDGIKDLSLMIATGDLTDNMTLNETRRYIDNLDGVSGAPTAYEANCGYTTNDSRGVPKLGVGPCTADMRARFRTATGALVADSQAPEPNENDPTYALTPTRSARQLAETYMASQLGGSHHTAPGLPGSLRCTDGSLGCDNRALAVPHYAVFGNHDASVRGTLTMQQPFQAGAATFGRYFFESQREFINEWFYTTAVPGPVGHGFNEVGSTRLNDLNDRNDGYYAFDAAGGQVRMIVINTIFDGVNADLHRKGATNSQTGGLVAGNEVTPAPATSEQGFFDQEQYDWLKGELEAPSNAGKAAIVFSHHPDRSFSYEQFGSKSPAALNGLLGSSTNVVNVMAHIAGHTHENVIRACTPAACSIKGTVSATVARPFWRIETASLIDFPQEGRIVEIFKLSDGRYALKLSMIAPDPADLTASISHRLSLAEANCTTSAILGGPLNSGPYTQQRLQNSLAAGEAAVRGNYCQGLDKAQGDALDRDTILLP